MAVISASMNVAGAIKALSSSIQKLNGAQKVALAKSSLFIKAQLQEDISKTQFKRADGTRGPSVDTGRFLNSVGNPRRDGVFEITKSQATIGTNVKYAKYLEFGTLKMKPRRHFQRTLNQNKKELNNLFASTLKKEFEGGFRRLLL